MSRRIAVISDTHNLLRPQVLDIIKTCDGVIHGGDCSRQDILDEIKASVPGGELYVVRGNNDKEWAEHLPETLAFSLEGTRIFLVHNKKFIPKDLAGVDLIIFGHSHKYLLEETGSTTLLNPGSCGRRRFNQEITMAVLTIDGGRFKVEKVLIPHETKEKPVDTGIGIAGIREIMKRQAKGQSLDRIAGAAGCSKALAEEICRIIVTHPGVTAEQIMNKMEVNGVVTRASARQ